MPRIALLNMALGFLAVFLAACGGVFVANDATNAFLHHPQELQGWQFTLMASAHGHTNLFGMLHILFGLTLPYSGFKGKTHVWQSVGLGLGTLGMSVLMVLRSFVMPSATSDPLGIVLGIMLGAALVAIGSHTAGLLQKLLR